MGQFLQIIVFISFSILFFEQKYISVDCFLGACQICQTMSRFVSSLQIHFNDLFISTSPLSSTATHGAGLNVVRYPKRIRDA